MYTTKAWESARTPAERALPKTKAARGVGRRAASQVE